LYRTSCEIFIHALLLSVKENNKMTNHTEELKAFKCDLANLQSSKQKMDIQANSIADRIAALEAAVDRRATKNGSAIERPEIGQDYWFSSGDGNIVKSNWDEKSVDKERYIHGNVHLSEERQFYISRTQSGRGAL
jgi:hypothetical protein